MKDVKGTFKENWRLIFLTVFVTIAIILIFRYIVLPFVAWSNSNQGFIMVILIILFAVAMLTLFYMNLETMKLSRKQLEILEMPNIKIGFEMQDDYLNLRVKNEGISFASAKLNILEYEELVLRYGKETDEEYRYFIKNLNYIQQNRLSIMPNQALTFAIFDRRDELIHSMGSVIISGDYMFDGKVFGMAPQAYSIKDCTIFEESSVRA